MVHQLLLSQGQEICVSFGPCGISTQYPFQIFKYSLLMDLFRGYLILALLGTLILSQTYDQSANLQALETKILAYQADLAKLQKQVHRLKRDLTQAQTTTIKIGALNEAQADQRDALISISSYLNLPFKYSQCECIQLSLQQRKLINRQIRTVRKQVKALKYDLALQERCPKMDAVRSELQRQLNYLETVQYALNSNCCSVPKKVTKERVGASIPAQNPSGFTDISTHIIQTNLNAGQWIYGCLSKSEVKLRYFARAVNANVTNCPDAKPYFNNVSCVSCPSERPIWDLCLGKCTRCSPGTQYNNREHTCSRSSSSSSSSSDSSQYKWRNTTASSTKQVEEIVPPIIGSSTITIVTKNRTRTVTGSRRSTARNSRNEGRGHEFEEML